MDGLIHVGGWEGLEYQGTARRLMIFEPQAEPFARLEARFDGYPNVALFNVALGARRGTATMHTADPSHSSSLLSPGPVPRPISFDGTEEVEVRTLDEMMRDRHGFHTLRIDTQGYELEVLKGGEETLRGITRIEIEFHDPNAYLGAGSVEDTDAFLAAQGFTRIEFNQEQSDDLGDAVYVRTC